MKLCHWYSDIKRFLVGVQRSTLVIDVCTFAGIHSRLRYVTSWTVNFCGSVWSTIRGQGTIVRRQRTLIEKKSSYLPRIVCQNDVSWFSWSRFFFSQLLIIASLDADTLVCGFHEARVGNIGASWPPLYKVCALPLPLGCSPIRATSPRLGKPHAVSRKLFFFPQYIFDSFYYLCVYIYIFFIYFKILALNTKKCSHHNISFIVSLVS